MKRQRETTMTQEDLLREEYGDEAGQGAGQGLQRADDETIKSRRIVRVKRHNPQTCTVETEDLKQPVGFKLAGSFSSLSKAAPAAAAPKPAFQFTPAQPAFGVKPTEAKPAESKPAE